MPAPAIPPTNERNAGLHRIALRLPGVDGSDVPPGWKLVGETPNSLGERHFGRRGPASEHVELFC